MTIAIVLLVWESASYLKLVTPFLLPAVSTVLARIWQDLVAGKLLVDVGLTLYRTLAGLDWPPFSGFFSVC